MKKYTLEQLKTEKIAIHTKTQKIFDTLMEKFEENNIIWGSGYKATTRRNYWEVSKKNTICYLYYFDGKLSYDKLDKKYRHLIITPDQIDWGEDKKSETAQVNKGDNKDKTPAVFAKAQKDWNEFKVFLKEVEAYGRTLTGSQLKSYMAKERKLRGIK